MLQFVFQPFEAKPLDLQILCKYKEEMFNIFKIIRKLWYFLFNVGKMANIIVLWTLESLKYLHAYSSYLLNSSEVFLFSKSGFRVIDRAALRNPALHLHLIWYQHHLFLDFFDECIIATSSSISLQYTVEVSFLPTIDS